ncbi:hydroperoxide isomerase ALOXE3-like isoform X2 [Epinephelus fuscoguttatus]|uniref:hydroperoxide isomerase ALOXE3-like isoform X2 n=1 Tax=Epinephelus fuscoguttatus TaxID=293821 RepID=UPI0020D0429E|nr:hydroperoxide isomerase ALOXE3-like isoform X2 [Epinephelus fuscoguttatus]
MADYQVTVSTSYLDDAGTCDHVFIKLVGKDGESERTRLMDSKGESSFTRGAVSTFTVSCPVSIGKLVRIELEKQPSQNPDKWFPTKVEVKSPEGDTFKLVICQWITDSEVHRFGEGEEPGKQPFQKLDTGIPPPEEGTSNFPSDRLKTDSKVPRFIEGTEPGKRPFEKLDTGIPPPEEGTSNFPSDHLKTDSKVPRFREGTEPGKRPFEKLDTGIPPPEGGTSNFPSDRRQTDRKVPRFGEGTDPDKQPIRKPNIGFSSPAGDTYNFYIYCRNTDSEVSRFREGTAGDTYNFYIYCGNTDSEVPCFREGTDKMVFQQKSVAFEETRMAIPGVRSQTLSLSNWLWGPPDRNQREKDYRWHEHAEGIPHCMKAEDLSDLPSEVQFSFTKDAEFKLTAAFGLVELKVKGLADSRKNWHDIDAIKGVFWCKNTDISDYVQEHWKEDAFFAYQFLNGVNPMLIRRCSALPDNFPVTDDMVFPSGQFSLENEMEEGNIFLCDYKRLEGVKANIIHDKQQYLMAPLVLLHKTPDDKLMPVAIQLKQTPAEDNPIFLPTDSEYDWLTAKIFVRSADFNEHQINSHLLRTHLLAEVFAVSLLRNMDRTHPLYKVLAPHTRYTLHINFLARDHLISETGVFTTFAASGGEGMVTLMQKSLSSVTYSSLCIPEDITERGLEDVPNFYYRDDGLKLWDIIHRYVQGVLSFYYKNNDAVKEDDDLQKWIGDIFEHGFLSQEGTGIPQSFTTVKELVKFVTMVIFTCSAQHSAVNAGQYDYGGWMPNTPISLQLPPPKTKGTTSEATMLQTLPDMGTTANGMAVMWLLSKPSSDFVVLGKSLEYHHSEEIPSHYIKAFQGELQTLSARIKIRNIGLEVPYTYLDPAVIENSVAI